MVVEFIVLVDGAMPGGERVPVIVFMEVKEGWEERINSPYQSLLELFRMMVVIFLIIATNVFISDPTLLVSGLCEIESLYDCVE